MRRAVLLLACLATTAPAVTIVSGPVAKQYQLPGTTAAAEPTLAGVVQQDKVVAWENVRSADGKPSAHGTIQLRVVRVKAGTLDFYWKVNVDPASVAPVIQVFVSGFPSGTYDANWRSDGLGTAAPGSVLAEPLRFQFNFFATPIAPGQSSRFFFVRTKAVSFSPTAATFAVLSAQSTATDQPAPKPL